MTIIGAGRIGGAIALSLPPEKYRVEYLITRDNPANAKPIFRENDRFAAASLDMLPRISSEIVFITTQDSQIGAVTETISEKLDQGSHVFHTSGSQSSAILKPLSARGCAVGSIHPLVSVSTAELGPEKFRGAYFCVEGDARAMNVANQIVKDLEGLPFGIDADKKTLYHAAAVMACGHLVALVETSVAMMSRCGMTPEFAKTIIGPLVESTIRNVNEHGAVAALTGPFARADVETFDRHLSALEASEGPVILELYLTLAAISLDLALEQGADVLAVKEIRERIAMAKLAVR